MDLASPGENIRSSTNPNSYSSWDGSSMASPVAASVFGLVKSKNMDWTNEMVRTMVLATADPVIYDVNSENYLDGMLGKGRVDAYKAIQTPLFPKIEYAGEDIFILNDFDGNINPGEEIELSVVLVNDPNWGTATNPTGFLVSLNSNVTYATFIPFKIQLHPKFAKNKLLPAPLPPANILSSPLLNPPNNLLSSVVQPVLTCPF